ncbi:hypothetical protein [Chryseobacterium sp. BIGb0232]|uniref:hypothetical protein n=1 Tax=Chryseobacterium sp. BIGb0232 TaxID=2940598 RepID=UPI000F48F9E2|nr:hypothetical protein [Chryseobacterium sp. BIGb0232]MCS4305511.1 hypothetical protein [Chryseobacterium sp. BIGb0232]ROS06634.1 hypothetical protein EDF65_5179 [Chryseobacterium nakagawai]
MIELINTIEINPFKYCKEDIQLPTVTEYPDPEEWFMKWEEMACQLKINFNTIKKGSYLADIEAIDDEGLQTIIDVRLSEVEFDDPGEEVFLLSFDGGIVLKKDGEILIEPSCCGDLSNIEDWQKIFDSPSSEWKDLWIGHPWVLYKRENGTISFSEYTEDNIDDIKNIKIRFEVDESALKAELEKVRQQQIHFKNRISGIVMKKNIDSAERLSQLMSGIQ